MPAKRMAGRNATRLIAGLALLGAAAAVAVILLGSDIGNDADDTRAGDQTPPQSAGDNVQAGRAPRPDPVRNASPQPDWRPYSGPVPIFRYHAVGEVPAGEPSPELFVEPADFAAQMDWLQSHGYEAVDLRTVERAWFEEGTLPSKPVVLTFDDAVGDLADAVLPDLSRRGWPGVVVLDGEAPVARKPLIDRLLAAGWEVAAAGTNTAASRRNLEAELGPTVTNYSFPADSFDEGKVPALEAAGYDGATVTGAGFATSADPYEMPRITVYGLSGVDGFAEAMRSRGEGVGA
jgi:peptidoglycan/xylan/chitin deacetylase (PgdA/CDA1 family)